MYLTKKSIVADNENFLNSIIKHDRERYRWCFESIMRFITEEKVMIGGDAAINFYADTISIDDIVFKASQLILYSESVYQMALKLADFMYKESGKKLITVKPIWQDIEYDIMIDTRKICKFMVLEEYKGVNIFKLIAPVTKLITIKEKDFSIKLMSPEILLIDIYRNLISPELYDDREKFKQLEESLFKFYHDERQEAKLNKRITTTHMGSAEVSKWRKIENFKYTSEFIVKFKHFILDELKSLDPQLLIVGRQAVEPEPNLELLEVCTNVTDTAELFGDFIEKFQRKYPIYADTGSIKFTFDIFKYRINIPVDMRLRRQRINLLITDGDKKSKFQIVDLFNATQYDLVMNHPYTILRFLFVDIWTLELLFKIGDLSPENYKQLILRHIGWVNSIRAKIPEYEATYNDFTKYLGTFDSEILAKRRFLQRAKKDKSEMYYPAI